MTPVELRTPRLVLDQPRLDDVDAIVEYCRDPLFERFLPTPWPYERAHAVDFVSRFAPEGWANDREFTWAIRASRGLIGTIGIGPRPRRDHEGGADVWTYGYWLGAPHRGHGYMLEASLAVLDWAFAQGPSAVRWDAVVGNVASARVARAAGFRYLGRRADGLADRSGRPEESWHAELRATDPRTPASGWPPEVVGPSST